MVEEYKWDAYSGYSAEDLIQKLWFIFWGLQNFITEVQPYFAEQVHSNYTHINFSFFYDNLRALIFFGITLNLSSKW